MVEALQAQYTSVAEGPGGRAGFQFVAQSPGLHAGQLSELERFMHYRPPASASTTPSPAEVERLPVSFQLQRLDSGAALLIRTTYAGKDYSGRYGNYFAHLVVLDSLEGLGTTRPTDLFNASWWRDQAADGADLPRAEIAGTTDATEPAGAVPVADGRTPDALAVYASGTGLTLDGANTVYVIDEPAAPRSWLEMAYLFLPPSEWWSLTFNTYAADPRQANGRLRFTVPGQTVNLQPYELESSASLVETGGRLAGRKTPFGAVVGGLIDQGDGEAVRDLASRIGQVATTLTPQILDGMAIAFDGDPDVHELSAGDQWGALRTVLEHGEGVFTARHVAWLFEGVGAERGEEVAALFSDARRRSGDLAASICDSAFSWMLHHPERVDLTRLRADSAPPSAWARRWIDAVAEVCDRDVSACVNLGLAFGLASEPAIGESLGVTLATRMADAETAAEILDRLDEVPRPIVEGVVDQLSDAARAGAIDAGALGHPRLADELSRRLRAAPDFDTAAELLELLRRATGTLVKVDIAIPLKLMRSDADAETLVGAAGKSTELTLDTVAALVAGCTEARVSPPRALVEAIDGTLADKGLRPGRRERNLAKELRRLTAASVICDAVVIADDSPQTESDCRRWVRSAIAASTSALPNGWGAELRAEACQLVVGIQDPSQHGRLLDELIANGGKEVLPEYLDALQGRVRSRRDAPRTIATIFVAWSGRREHALGEAEFSALAARLGERQRDEVARSLPRGAAARWQRWCERHPPKGFLGRLSGGRR